MNDVISPTRRTVVRSAAWSVPVVAVGVGAPAFAASCASTSYTWRLDWGNETTDDAFTTSYPSPSTVSGIRTGTATITGPAGTTPMTVTFRSSNSGTDSRTNNNLRVDAATYPNVGNTGGTGLLLQHQGITAGRANSYQQVDITFGRAVSNLRFTISDIDSSQPGWFTPGFYDQVELSGTRSFTFTARPGNNNGTYVVGAGTQNDPWRMYDQDEVASDNNDAKGNVVVHYPSPGASITLIYYTSQGTGNQAIFLSDLTFDASAC